MTGFDTPREIDPADIALSQGHTIEPVARNLTFPSAIAFDDQNRLYVIQAGYSYGDVKTTPRLLRIEPDGSTTAIAEGDKPPWNGVAYHDGSFYIAGGHTKPGQILCISMTGDITPLVDNLPSLGDHFPRRARGRSGRLAVLRPRYSHQLRRRRQG